MLGSIIGDIAGSVFEFNNVKAKGFSFFDENKDYTDDSVLTVATADWLLNGGMPGDYYYRYARMYPNPMGAYGSGFLNWVYMSREGDLAQPYNSCGNGSAMRVGPVGWAFDTLNETLDAAKASAECTHNHPEGIKGAQATAHAIFMARNGASVDIIRDTISREYGYDLSLSVDEIRAKYSWEGIEGAGMHGATCQGSVPQAITCALEAVDFEDAIRNAVSIGGDSDTIACITGSIAEAIFDIPDDMYKKALDYLPEHLRQVIAKFEKGENTPIDIPRPIVEEPKTEPRNIINQNNNNMVISEKIQQIINQRAKHLPKIRAMKTHLDKMLEKLDKLDNLVAVVNGEIAQQQGDYYAMIAENPKMEIAFRKVNTHNVRSLITEQLKRLEILEKRFGRDTVCIAMIGYEGQGKSTFLQAISGLENEVIPAYSGTSCTGAVSVLLNTDGEFRTEIEMYSLEEFLEIVKAKLAKFFPGRSFILNNADDLKNLDLSGFDPKGPNRMQMTTEFNKFQEAYCGHIDEYKKLFGSGKVTIKDPKSVIKYVAQYQLFDTAPEGLECHELTKNDGSIVFKHNYYNYIAVKNVTIYKQFNLIDCRQIQLVDTIGLGDATNADKIEKEMFRVLREDCDAAVNIFKPDSLGRGLNQAQVNILQKISNELGDREPSKWIVYVVNKVASGFGANSANIPEILSAIKKMLDTAKDKPVAWCKAVQGNSVNEVRDLLVNPLLDLISSNLPDLDANLMQDAFENGQKLYSAYYTLASLVQSVLSKSRVRGGEGKVFDDLFKAQTKKFDTQLRILDEEEYGARRSEPCPEIADCLEATIDSLYDLIPEVETIEEKVDQGNKSLNEIFGLGCDDLCNSIFKSFENVSLDVIVPLREEVKNAIAKVLYNEGSMGRIILKNYRVSDGPCMEWLKCLIDERVDGEAYPHLRDALQYVLGYHFNIEDSIEYDVATCIGIIDKMNTAEYIGLFESPTGTVAERADALWQELANRIPPIQENMRKCRDKFALIPSHSFATRVQKFRVKMVFDEKVREELREFYRDNSYSLWRDEFAKIEGQEQAFGQWNEMVSEISELCVKEVFEFNK